MTEILHAFGFPAFAPAGYEADDVLATLARELRAAGEPAADRHRRSGSAPVRGGIAPASTPSAGAPRAAPTTRRRCGPASAWPRTSCPTGRRWSATSPTRSRACPASAARPPAPWSAASAASPACWPGWRSWSRRRCGRRIAGLTTDLPLWRDLTRLHDDVPLPEGPRWAALDAAAQQRAQQLFQQLEFKSLLPRLAALPVAPDAHTPVGNVSGISSDGGGTVSSGSTARVWSRWRTKSNWSARRAWK